MGRPRDSILERFFSFFEKGKEEDCWEWQGFCDKRGYAKFMITNDSYRKNFAVHRIAFMINQGMNPETDKLPEGLFVCHKFQELYLNLRGFQNEKNT